MPANYEEWKQTGERRYPNGERIPEGQPDTPEADTDEAPPVKRLGGCGSKASMDSSWALVLIVVGVLYFLSNLGLFRIDSIWQFWPVSLIVIGVSSLSTGRGRMHQRWGIAMVLIGAIMLLVSLNLVKISGRILWPMFLVGAGVVLMLRNMKRSPARTSRAIPARSTPSSMMRFASTPSSGVLSESSTHPTSRVEN